MMLLKLLPVCICLISTFGRIDSGVFAREPEFKLRTRYEDNDYSAEDRDVIEGFRMSFVPPKWERMVTSPNQKYEDDILCDDFTASQEKDSTTLTEDNNIMTTVGTEPTYCPTQDGQYDEIDFEEKEEYDLETATAKTTKIDHFVSGILERGEKICGIIVTTNQPPMKISPACETTATMLNEDATLMDYEYDDDVVTEGPIDDICHNYKIEGIAEDPGPDALQCRHNQRSFTEKFGAATIKYSQKAADVKKEQTAPPIFTRITQSISEMTISDTAISAVAENNVPENVPYSSCVVSEVNLDEKNELHMPKNSYAAIIIADDTDNASDDTDNASDEKEGRSAEEQKFAKEQRLARQRRLRKRVQEEHWQTDRSSFNEAFIGDHVAFESDSDILPDSGQIMHKGTVNVSQVPTESDEDTLLKSLPLKRRLHENFWLQNEEEAHVRETHARNMKKYIDFSVNPCDDFFQYACGNWYKFNPIPTDRNNYDTFDLLRESLDLVLRDILDDKEITKGDDTVWKGLHPIYRTKSRRTLVPDYYDMDDEFYLRMKDDHLLYGNSVTNKDKDIMEATMKAKYMYSSCMNTELLKKRGIQPALDLISILGGWPLLDPNWKHTDYEFEWLLAQLRLYNNDIILSEWVGPDMRNSKEYIIQIDQTTLGLPSREYYLEPGHEEILLAYQKYIVAIGLGMGANEATISGDVLDIVSFEIELASITVPNDVPRNVSEIYIRLTISELHQLIPQFNWLRYFRLVSNNYIQADDEVVLYCLQYIRNMVELISQSDVRTVTNYLLWRFMRHRVNNLDDRFQIAKQRFYKIVFGRENQPPRWQNCVMHVNSNMGMAVGKLFVSKYYTKQSKDDTVHMTKYIREAFADILRDTTWLDSITTDLALIKLASMRLKIGYPNYILNQRKLNKRYNDVQVNPRYYFENTLSILQHLTRLEHLKLKRPVDKSVWNSAPAIVNAYYSRNKNQIIFPAGILQPPFYHRHFPKSMNFGGIGIVMGHEMTHGFDDKGRLFDKEGNLKNWWKDESIEEFHERTQCLIEQYNHYLIPEANMQLDGESTQGENIADNGGLKQAFLAYQYWLKDNESKKHQENLPGLNLTNMQLFFLNFAQIWCGDMRAEAAVTRLPGALHSPGRFRVIGSVSNSEEFAAVFNCPIPAPMNPDNKCTIW